MVISPVGYWNYSELKTMLCKKHNLIPGLIIVPSFLDFRAFGSCLLPAATELFISWLLIYASKPHRSKYTLNLIHYNNAFINIKLYLSGHRPIFKSNCSTYFILHSWKVISSAIHSQWKWHLSPCPWTYSKSQWGTSLLNPFYHIHSSGDHLLLLLQCLLPARV